MVFSNFSFSLHLCWFDIVLTGFDMIQFSILVAFLCSHIYVSKFNLSVNPYFVRLLSCPVS